MDKNRRGILPTIPRPSRIPDSPATGTSVASGISPRALKNPIPSTPRCSERSMGPWGAS